MPYRLRKNRKRLRRNQKRARSGCRARCCGPGPQDLYYWAVRCDIYLGEPIPEIPADVPLSILIPVPYSCGEESCEIEGLRLVIYGGYCYVVMEEPGQYQTEPGCTDRLLARRFREDFFPPPAPPIVDPADITCKERTATCENSECIPVAPPEACCPAGGEPCTPESRPCDPCDCPRFSKYALRVTWEGAASLRDADDNHTATYITRGTFTALFDCTSGQLVVTGGGTGFVGYTSGGPDGPGFPSPEPITVFPLTFLQSNAFGHIPRNVIALAETAGIADGSGSATYNPQAFLSIYAYPGQPCNEDYLYPRDNSSIDGFSHAALTASCLGGDGEQSGSGAYIGTPNIIRNQHQSTIRWTWVPLVACPQDPNPFIGGSPHGGRNAAVPLTRATLRKMLTKFGGLK